MTTLAHAILALLLGLGLPAGDWWDDDPLSCPQPDEPNCGAPNGAGGWLPEDPPEPAQPAAPASADPSFTG